MIGRADRPAAIMAGSRAAAKPGRHQGWLRRIARGCGFVGVIALLLGMGAAPAVAAGDDSAQLAAWIATLAAGEEAGLQAFYAARDYRPAWPRHATLKALAAAVGELAADGLAPEQYRVAELGAAREQLDRSPEGPRAAAALDLRASRVWFAALRDLGRGRDPPDWVRAAPAPALDPAQISRDLDAGRLDLTLARVRPDDASYRALRAGLARYRALQRRGGWPPVPEGIALHPGTSDARIPALRARLDAEGLGTPPAADAQYFDADLAAAVREFQRRHQLAADAVVGARTRAELNRTVAQRIAQLRVGLERARWLRAVLPDNHVLVDIAGHELSLERPSADPWRTRVIVGRPSRPTPVLSSRITRLEFHPTWTIPPTILRKDVLPKVRRDPRYLAQERIDVLNAAGTHLEPASVDWSRPGAVLLRQHSGGTNPLGRVVIRFPNPHLVYLHDTPARELFARERRAISSGCIRVEDALELVVRLLDGQPGWDRAAVLAAVADQQASPRVELARPMPLLLWYRTVRADAEDRLIFAPDIYGLDAGVLAALERAAW